MEIRKGDVVIFEAGNDWVGKSIALLTRSTVSHAALGYDRGTIVEMGLSGISVNPLREDPSGRKAYLLRMTPERDFEPVAKAAKVYADANIPYDIAALVVLGGLLVYKAVCPTPRWGIITGAVLRLACCGLDKLYKLIVKKGQKAMMCSQLVYQCYYDCGKDYRIIIRDGRLQSNAVAEPENSIRLIDMLEEMDMTVQMPVEEETATDQMDMIFDFIDVERVAEELYASLEEAPDVPANDMLETANFGSILPQAAKFLDLLEKILKASGMDIPLASLFVTPADLLEHAENLELIGEFDVIRSE